LRCNVTTGLEHAPGLEPAAPGAVEADWAVLDANPFKSMEVNAASRDPAGAGTNGANDSDMACNCDNYKLADLTLSKTVTRRLISLPISVSGMGTVAP
jgi:hypothetical protein